ncbi:MAG: repeat domain protein, partial [Myxococcaceae bacterium]|nr:repeat domain protein [Myxococcaceae bacterium]
SSSRRRSFAFLPIAMALASAVLPGCKKHKPPPRVRIWMGASHACSLQKNGELECWGRNDAGQLGDRSTTTRALPAPVVSPGKVDDLAVGARHTCALSAGGVRCWGDGTRGQLGTGLTSALSAPTVPVVASGAKGAPLAGVTAVAAGGDRSCALTADGVRCWGDGVVDAVEPDGFRGVATKIAVGGEGFACAAFSERDVKTVRCVGSDDRGQSAAHQPILAQATVAGITAGAKHACVVLDNGDVQCWGANDHGQLGDGTHNDARTPALVHMPAAVEVRAGATYTCARLRNNTVACWGDNRAHQLVNGTSQESSSPAPIPGLVGVQELSLGGDSGCARLLDDGAVRCWGANTFGQLGDGTTQPHDVPMPVKAAPISSAAR